MRELTTDWYKIFSHVTKFKTIRLADIKDHAVFGPRLKHRTKPLIATIAEINDSKIPISKNPNDYGIPQGTPISSAMSNLYMIDVDVYMADLCANKYALYQRYSDDILVVCQQSAENSIVSGLHAIIKSHALVIKKEKTERVIFDVRRPKAFQYLGFNISPDGAVIRCSGAQ